MIPAYQAEDWIADAIHSARAQTWPNKEIIVVDDGSTDGTLRVASRFSSNAVKVVSQPNQGACAARNKAFSLCQGDYIQWLDADDLLAPDKIAKQFEKIDRCRSKTTLLCSAWGRCYYRSEKAKFTPTPLWQDLQPVEWLIRKYENNLWMSPESWLVSRELSEAAGPWDIRLLRNNDGEYFDRVVCASDGIRFVPEARSYLRTVNFHSISSDLHGAPTAKLVSRLTPIGTGRVMVNGHDWAARSMDPLPVGKPPDREAHRRGIRVISELVLNHTSDQHAWFQRARRARPGSPARNFYVWNDNSEKYKDARIIFKDFETSNLTWDPVANLNYQW